MNKEVSTLLAGRGAQALLTIAAFRLLTTFISPSEVGGFYLIMSMASLFSLFLLNPVGMYVNRKLFVWYDQKTVFEHFLGFNVYTLLVSALAFGIVLFSWSFLGVGAGLPGLLFAFIVACYIYVLNWNQTIIPTLNAFGHKTAFVLLTTATTGIGLVFSIVFVKFFKAGAVEWVSGQVVALGLLTLAGVCVFRRKVPENGLLLSGTEKCVTKESLLAVAAFALPLAGATFFMWAQGQSYRVIVEKIRGPEFLAYLAVGFSIATSVAGILESLVQQIYLPAFYRRISTGGKDERRSALRDLAARAIPVYLIYLFFIIGLSEHLVYFLVAPKYREVFVYARYGAVVEFFRMSTNILASAAHSEMRTKSLITPYLLGGVSAAVSAYFAAMSSRPELFVPLALLLSGVITFFDMQRAIFPIIEFKLDARSLAAPGFFSLAFLVAILIHPKGLVQSLALLGAAGAYFLFLQYWFSRKWLGSAGKIPAPAAQPVDTENLAPAEKDVL
ncbi:MAG: hypothetical protein NTY45_08545 [Elusimicrobia bacterium]|nr:hypothetical protein [Elusimicrobiota bacterium]